MLSCNEYESGTDGPTPPFWPVSDATTAESNSPIEVLIVPPPGASAVTSLPFPTIIGRGPLFGTCK
ncbi:hypothetical protein GCM10029964_037130 [Kibdelosporangium lantanae]